MISLTNHGRRLLTRATHRETNLSICQQTVQRTFLSTYFANDSDTKSTESSGIVSKGDMSKMIAEDNDMSQAQASRIVNSIFDTIVEVSF
jgi:hypothetical protein